MMDYRRLQALVNAIRKEGPTNELLKQTVIMLADQVIAMQREIDRINSIASRADRNSRMGMGVRR